MSHYDDVATKRLQRANGVVERLAFLDRRSARRDVRHIRGQCLRRELERNARASRCLGEEKDDGASAKRRRAPYRALKDLDHRSGLIEDGLDLVARPVIGVEDVASAPLHASTLVTTSTSSRPSTSARCTRTSSPTAVGTFFPTKSARIGSSRCPRSTRTARRIARGRP